MNNPVFAIIGLGVFGSQLALTLAANNAEVVAIDNSEEAVNRVKNKVTHSFLVDVTDENFLSRVPLDNIDTAIVAVSAFETCALAVAFLKQAGVPYIIARTETSIQALILKKIGADEAIIVEIEQGIRLAKQLINPDILEIIHLSKTVCMAEYVTTPTLFSKMLVDIKIFEQLSLNVVAIRRANLRVGNLGQPEKFEDIIIPSAKEMILEGDILLIIGALDNIRKLSGE